MYYLNTSDSFNCYSILYYEFLTIPVRKHAYSVCKEHWPKSFVLIVMHDLIPRWLQSGLPCKESSTKHLRFFEYFLKTVWHHHFTGLIWSHMLFCFQKSQLCLFQLRKNVYGKSSNKLKINSVLLKHVTNFEQINWTNLLLLLLSCEMDFSTELFRIKEKFIRPSWATVGPQTTTDNISSYSLWLIHFCSHIAVGYIMKRISEAEFDHKCFNFAIQCK